MKMKSVMFGVAFMIITINVLAQQMNGAYLLIAEEEYIPTIEKEEDNYVILNHPRAEYALFYNQFKIIEFKQAFPQVKSQWLRKVYEIQMTSQEQIDDFIKQVSTKYAQQIPIVEKIGEIVADEHPYYPNDSLYVAGELSHLDYVRAPEAWNIAKHYGKTKVGVVDWYFHQTHPDLIFDTIYGNNPLDNIHGTKVSGFIAGVNDNHIGIASTGGYNTNLTAYHITAGSQNVYKLAQKGCKIINCSWHSTGGYSVILDSLHSEILNEYDCLVIGAAGNNTDGGMTLSTPVYPASYSSCLSVTSIGHKKEYGDSSFRNWKDVHNLNVNDSSTSHHHNKEVDVCAPGYEMRTTNYADGISCYSGPSSGTSFATPIVTGIAAMIRAVNPSLSAVETMNIIKETANPCIYDLPENANYIGRLGTGKVDAYAAVRRACAVDIADSTLIANTNLDGCIITLQNVQAQNGITIDINAVVETQLISDVYIPFGSSLIIH